MFDKYESCPDGFTAPNSADNPSSEYGLLILTFQIYVLIMRYALKGKARTRPDFFRVVLGPCAQFFPCEASEQKWGQTPKS